MPRYPRLHLDWGWRGARNAADRGSIVVIVDVLRFSSAVAAATSRGATIYPCAFEGDAQEIAKRHGAEVASRSWSGTARYSLSPRSYHKAEAGVRVVLPSLNGAECSVRTKGASLVIAGALVNAPSVAAFIAEMLAETTDHVTVVACGERWPQPNEDGALRFAIEDFIGAGAILHELPGEYLSAEAQAAAAAYKGNKSRIGALLRDCASGRELVDKGLEQDVRDCAQIGAYAVVPILSEGAYRAAVIDDHPSLR